MHFVWIWEQAAIISPYSIYWLVCITDGVFLLRGTDWIYVYNRYNTVKAQWSLYVPPGLTLNNSTFCPHSVFMCFVWISEQIAIISLYNINWLVCITETERVYCAVRTGYLNVIEVNWIKFLRSAHTLYLCVLCGSQSKQPLFPYTSLTEWFL